MNPIPDFDPNAPENLRLAEEVRARIGKLFTGFLIVGFASGTNEPFVLKGSNDDMTDWALLGLLRGLDERRPPQNPPHNPLS